MTKEKTRDNLEWMDAPIKSDRWVNMWFLKTGEFLSYGCMIHPSAKAAKNDAKRAYFSARPIDIATQASARLGRTVFWSELSPETIPMPVS